jgi:hypothetical protein
MILNTHNAPDLIKNHPIRPYRNLYYRLDEDSVYSILEYTKNDGKQYKTKFDTRAQKLLYLGIYAGQTDRTGDRIDRFG